MRKLICLVICVLFVAGMAVPAAAEGTQADVPGAHSEEEASGGDGQTPQPPECTHSWDGGSVIREATCVAEGERSFTCTLCGATRTEAIPATGAHTYGPWQSIDGSRHTHTCTHCVAQETTDHEWDAGQITLQPTCSAPGTRTYTCGGCGATRTESVSAEATAHAYGEWTVSETGHSRTCSGCGKTESGNHSWNVSATVPATCKDEGATAYGCTTCGAISYTIIPKLTTHTYDNACDPECNVCGAVREAEHKFNTAWSKNAQGHWHVCAVCGEKKDVGSHYPGPAATEERAQLCLTCGYTLMAKRNHTHKFATTWTGDETGHWYACSGCEEEKDFSEHSYDGPCDPECNVCGFVRENVHSYGGTWLSDETGHWFVCTACGEASEAAAHVPGPEATDTQAQLCQVCGFEMAPAQVHIHEFGADWEYDEDIHWKRCECGERSEAAAHDWEEAARDKKTVELMCTVCLAEKTQARESSFPWWTVWLAVGVVCIGAAAGAIVMLSGKKSTGRFVK